MTEEVVSPTDHKTAIGKISLGIQNITTAMSDLDNTTHGQVNIANELSKTSELITQRALTAFELAMDLERLALVRKASTLPDYEVAS